jgi:hypothetical protein
MPPRTIDYDALWPSQKIGMCKPENRTEYLWLYGLADANGSFELTSLRAISAQVSVNRPELTPARLREIFLDFRDVGLLCVWKEKAKIFGHWIGSEKRGRLPPVSLRGRYKPLAPKVPKNVLDAYNIKIQSRLDQDHILTGEDRIGEDRIGEVPPTNLDLSRSLLPPTNPETEPPKSNGNFHHWEKIKQHLKTVINPHSFSTWFKPTQRESEDAENCIVRVPTQLFLKRMTETYATNIRAACVNYGLSDLKIKFIVK